MSAWLDGLGVGLFWGIVLTVLIMARLERKRIREDAEFQRRRLAFWQTFWSQQLAARTPEQDAVERLLASL